MHCLYIETCTGSLKSNIYLSSDCILTTCIMWFNFVAALSSPEDITTMTWADSLDHQRQTTWLIRFSIQRLRLSKQHLDGRDVIIVGLRTYPKHMIEQKGSLDMLRMLDFMRFLKSCSTLWCLAHRKYSMILVKVWN